jgi:large subunit ribosomal protein L17
MRHRKAGRKLGRSPAHRKALYRNLLLALLTHEKIETTEPKAKELRRFVEKVITRAKRGGLAQVRQVERVLRDRDLMHKLFHEIAPRYATRPGGYTRLIKLPPRNGDSAAMSLIELVEGEAPEVEAG